MQTSLAKPVQFQGIGVHSGQLVTMTIRPASADTGIIFVRQNQDGANIELPATAQLTVRSNLSTTLRHETAQVGTIEHVMSALSGMGIDNALIDIDSDEVAILDGSALPFVEAFQNVGIQKLDKKRIYIKVLKPVRVEAGDAFAQFEPYNGWSIKVGIDFPHKTIGQQQFHSEMNAKVYHREIAPARTFGFIKDIEFLWAAGLALGSSVSNSVVLDMQGKALNPQGLRFVDEFVRHKTLDVIGDIALLGYPLLGAFHSFKSGHQLNAAAVAALLGDKQSYELVSL